MDLSSAFNCVPFETLLECYERICSPSTMNFIKSQHTQRKCILIEKGIESDKFQIPLIGVPQGEPNSPNSFSIIINGVFEYAKKDEIREGQIHVQGFADDTGAGIKGKKGTSERRNNRIS